ncbi:carboxylesterase/lipase family protein [Winogradskya humida]|uniref:Carboxylic ester hydrolase n=1 Tax=Winogradskya humida TaxID=113566 RepID=A0ABQ4A6F7_9ACTN|nr:carboxylesterase family protein [Actinoplanes humidus]GIE26398.1 carboxylic ester hydrolase [Actinoplanes humidus]
MTDPVVPTRDGAVRGTEIADGVLAWRGIPYAAAPVGDLRWRLPQAPEPWADVRDALAYGAPAIQPSLGAMGPAPAIPGMVAPDALPEPAEDCLYLNVTAPADADRLPVVVWLHGGGYHLGNATQGPGDGSPFAAAHRAVVVSFNYRLGSLGFLTIPREEHTGAYGLHDQIAALRWIHDNIAGFGGDPTRVTVFGVSAGAKSVANLLASPLTRGLFSGAVSYSGGADHVSTAEQDIRLQARYLRELGRNEADLRSVPAADLLEAQNGLAAGMRATWVWRPSVDGLALDRPPLDAITDGSATGVHLLVQHTLLEGLLYDVMVPGSADETDQVLTGLFGADTATAILAGYATARPDLAADPHRLRLEVFSDERYAIASTRVADAQSHHAPVWRSRFDGPLPGFPVPGAPQGPLPATHSTDVTGAWFGLGPAGAELFGTIGAFVTTGSPQAATLPAWDAYDDKQRPTMVLSADGGRLEADPFPAQRELWDGRTWPSGTWWPVDGL